VIGTGRLDGRPYAGPMLVGRSGLSPVMIGRAAELDRLVGLIGARSEPAVALLAGEAGIGKTRLVQELVRRAPEGTVVLAGQADPGAVGRPLELLLDAVEPALADRRSDGEDGADGGVPDDLVAAVRDADRPAEERIRAGVDLVRCLIAGRAGVVVFEDLHWADPESVAVFERLAEPPGDAAPRAGGAAERPGGLLLVGTYRPDGLSRRHPAAEALPRLERRHTVTHVQLERLSPSEVADFLAAVRDAEPSYRVVDALHSRTGGNPFFLEELVASAERADPGTLDALPLPWTVSELVRSEVDDLAPDVRAMVSAAAVLGRRVGFDVLAAVTGADEADLIERLRAAVDVGLLVEAEPDVFSFHHELAREAIEGGLLGRERRRLHEAALAALRATNSRNHVALAHHARGAGRYDDMVDEARLGAHESLALGSTYQALQLAETGLAEAPDDTDLRAVAARAAWMAGQFDEAEEHGGRWLALVRAAGDAAQEAEALALHARVAYERGDVDASAARAGELIAILDRLPGDEERARAMAAVAQSFMLREEAEATIEWADRAMALAEQLDLGDVRRAAMIEKGSMLIMLPERADEAPALLESAVADAEAAGDHLLAARALNNLVWHGRRWKEADEVRALIDRMHAHAEAAGIDFLSGPDAAGSLAHLAVLEGDLDGAIALLDEARDRPSGRSRWIATPNNVVFRAGLALEVGDLDTAARLVELVKPMTVRTAPGVLGLDFNLAARRGELARARAVLPDLLAAIDRERSASPSQVHDLLAAGLAAGLRPDELRPLTDRAGYFVGDRLGPDNPWHHLHQAQLTEAEGDIETAAAHYQAAAATLGSAPEILAGRRGTAHVGAAGTLAQLGKLDDARAHAAEAARHLARWRGWRVDQLRAVERRLGLGPEPSGPQALTPREREVAILLAEGLTNAQLAERLYISPRTAAVHVSNILSKLGMGSRAEVAAWAARAEAGVARSEP
jgi:DNA-binding CsgD family transcriptional regulator